MFPAHPFGDLEIWVVGGNNIISAGDNNAFCSYRALITGLRSVRNANNCGVHSIVPPASNCLCFFSGTFNTSQKAIREVTNIP